MTLCRGGVDKTFITAGLGYRRNVKREIVGVDFPLDDQNNKNTCKGRYTSARLIFEEFNFQVWPAEKNPTTAPDDARRYIIPG